MRAVVQRVGATKLTVDGKTVAEIPHGLTVYLGVGKGDGEEQAQKTAKKIAGLRIFSDAAGKMNLSVGDVGGEILLVSQFTLYGDCRHGNRPSFTEAEEPVAADRLYERTAELLRGYGLTVKTGVFGADMHIEQTNEGPVTILLEFS